MSAIKPNYDEEILVLPRTWQFEDVFDEYIYAHQEDRGSRKIGEYFPSELGYCVRQTFIKFFRPGVFSLETLKIFFSGNMFQDHFLSPVLTWKYGEQWHHAERPITNTIDDDGNKNVILLRGRIDDQLTFNKGRFIIPVEGKSQSGYVYKKTKPSDHHIAQIYPYLVGTNAEYGFLVYMDRSFNVRYPEDKVTKTFCVDFKYDYWMKLKDRIKYLDQCLRDVACPYAEAKCESNMKWMCNKTYCKNKFICEQLGIDELEFDSVEALMEMFKMLDEYEREFITEKEGKK